MTARATVVPFGDNLQISVPKAFVERLGGDVELQWTEEAGALRLAPVDQHAERMAIVRDIMRERAGILRELAK